MRVGAGVDGTAQLCKFCIVGSLYSFASGYGLCLCLCSSFIPHQARTLTCDIPLFMPNYDKFNVEHIDQPATPPPPRPPPHAQLILFHILTADSRKSSKYALMIKYSVAPGLLLLWSVF